MSISLFMRRAILVSLLMLTASFSTPVTHSADQLVQGAMLILPEEKELRAAASGAVEDTLKACLARIPEDASVGQHLLAQLSCEGAEVTRKAIQVVPKL